MCISFLLEANVEVCFLVISIFQQIDKIMQKVDDVKRQNKQLLLLFEMYGFMVDDDPIRH